VATIIRNTAEEEIIEPTLQNTRHTPPSWTSGPGILLVGILGESQVQVLKEGKKFQIRLKEGGWHYIPTQVAKQLKWGVSSGKGGVILILHPSSNDPKALKRSRDETSGEERLPSLALSAPFHINEEEGDSDENLLSKLGSKVAQEDTKTVVITKITEDITLNALAQLVALSPEGKTAVYGRGVSYAKGKILLDPTLDCPIPPCLDPIMKFLAKSPLTTSIHVKYGSVGKHTDKKFLRHTEGTIVFTAGGVGVVNFYEPDAESPSLSMETALGHVYGVPARVGSVTQHEVIAPGRVSVVVFSVPPPPINQ
jgi:hypothetical protein